MKVILTHLIKTQIINQKIAKRDTKRVTISNNFNKKAQVSAVNNLNLNYSKQISKLELIKIQKQNLATMKFKTTSYYLVRIFCLKTIFIIMNFKEIELKKSIRI